MNGVTVLLLLGTVTGRAQTTWNYTISDAGDGNSLVTWEVTGDLTLVPVPALAAPGSSLAISVVAPGIFADTYTSDGTLQNLATPDGSYFAYGADVYAPIVQYSTDTAAGNGDESFGLAAPLLPKTLFSLVYTPGTQSVLIPVPFSDFNPGTYQSVDSDVTTPLTVNLTVVPEPSALVLAALAVILNVASLRPRSIGR